MSVGITLRNQSLSNLMAIAAETSMNPRQLLNGSEVHLWWLSIGDASCLNDPDLVRVLSTIEQVRWEQMSVQAVKREYLMARALVRTALSWYCGVPPRDWRFVNNAYGRPLLASPFDGLGLNFSISHCHGVVACLIAKNHQVGLDVESRQRNESFPELLDRVLAEYEHGVIKTSLEGDISFLHYWTLKEAYSKAIGLGLSMPFDEIVCVLGASLDPRPVPVEYARLREEDWMFAHIPVDVEYIVAVAVKKANHETVAVRLAECAPAMSLHPSETRLIDLSLGLRSQLYVKPALALGVGFSS